MRVMLMLNIPDGMDEFRSGREMPPDVSNVEDGACVIENQQRQRGS